MTPKLQKAFCKKQQQQRNKNTPPEPKEYLIYDQVKKSEKAVSSRMRNQKPLAEQIDADAI